MQIGAIKLTCPDFDPEDFRRGHYSIEETLLINQIAATYSEAGQKNRAVDIDRQLLWYIEKYFKDLTEYASVFCLVAYNYAACLRVAKYYTEANEIAERGRRLSINYGDYQFLPGFLAIQAECSFFLDKREQSRKLYLQAYYLYKAFEDRRNQETIQQEMWERLGMELAE